MAHGREGGNKRVGCGCRKSLQLPMIKNVTSVRRGDYRGHMEGRYICAYLQYGLNIGSLHLCDFISSNCLPLLCSQFSSRFKTLLYFLSKRKPFFFIPLSSFKVLHLTWYTVYTAKENGKSMLCHRFVPQLLDIVAAIEF